MCNQFHLLTATVEYDKINSHYWRQHKQHVREREGDKEEENLKYNMSLTWWRSFRKKQISMVLHSKGKLSLEFNKYSPYDIAWGNDSITSCQQLMHVASH